MADSKFDAYEALSIGAKRAGEEIERMGGMEQFRRPGEHKGPTRRKPTPPPSLTAREYMERFGKREP